MIRKKKETGRIILPAGMKPRPEEHELHVASILSEHYRTDVEFLPRANQRTPDFVIDGVVWELKSPTGTGKNNIQRQLQDAHRQSKNVIIDASRSKMHATKIRRQVEHQFKIVKSVKRLLFVSKSGKVYEITR